MKKELGFEKIKVLPSENVIVEIDGAMYRCYEEYNNDIDAIEILFANVYDDYSPERTKACTKAISRSIQYSVISDEVLLIPFIKYLAKKAQDIGMNMANIFISGMGKNSNFHYHIMEQLNKIADKVIEFGDTVELVIYFNLSAIDAAGEIVTTEAAYGMNTGQNPFDAVPQWQKSMNKVMQNSHYGVTDSEDVAITNKKNVKVSTKATLTNWYRHDAGILTYHCSIIINNSTVTSINWRIKFTNRARTAFIVSVEGGKYFKKVFNYLLERARSEKCDHLEIDRCFKHYLSDANITLDTKHVKTMYNKMGLAEKYIFSLY